MSRQPARVRGQVIADLTKLGVSYQDTLRFLRLGATLHRLAEAQCNGVWPADNGERRVVTCGSRPHKFTDANVSPEGRVQVSKGCEGLYVRHVLRKSRGYLCPNCCATEDAKKLAEKYGLVAIVGGDPRGMVLGLVTMVQWNNVPTCGACVDPLIGCICDNCQRPVCYTHESAKTKYDGANTLCPNCAKETRPGADIDSGKVRPVYVY